MQIYLVGGAVRDQLLNYPVHERDWVVVGATPQELIQQGYKPVGKDFPVFLHPKTKEEYALARTERKSGKGYTGFTFYTAPDISLEQDLAWRDLTINAIARSADGKLVDPYGGVNDIKTKTLRHVSPAFSEDPLRVLRVARFAARYHHLGFSVAAETRELMVSMVKAGELDFLVPERIWKEFSRALLEQSPEIFITTLRQCGALATIAPEIDLLFGVPQPPQHHPEVDTGLHCLLSLSQAAKLSSSLPVRFATLVHDLGKAATPQEVLPRHIGHEKRSLPLVRQICERLKIPNDCQNLALLAAQFHTHCHRALELSPKKLLEVLGNLDAFRRPDRFFEFLLCCAADARGRTGKESSPYPQAVYLARAHDLCAAVTSKPFIESGLSGKKLGEAIRLKRLQILKQLNTEQLQHGKITNP